ncbi:apolipoprotein N-acyltransferase [Anatilimnocola aggregata]|uniref:Apolipoprotein N-acyltransferase n=1 Tax=Anatilimnocola aggregata TaxID=2528021 RepID=A0A517YJK1_9BACT|nr:carbon-nitrogen hydrolase family protein [Anatilimnocola aggregata]QDU30403.1 apolipoprotein N-acyltransferase [Anatilimnocola aggregata]
MPAKSKNRLRVATCQFPVEAEIAKNRRWALKQIEQASAAGADVVHFSECALSGYAGVEFPTIRDLNVDELQAATRDVMAAAKQHGVWVILGSTHYLDLQTKPHNCLYIINAAGEIVDRYDKRFCTGQDGKNPTLDLCHYTPGNRPVTFQIKGITCGVGICYDYRFPELYRELKQLGVQVLFQSFHNARQSVVSDRRYNIWKEIVPATMQCRAAENHFWVSANNSTARPSMWGSFTVQPDGALVHKLPVHKPGVLLTDMQLDHAYFDAAALWRESAMKNTLHSGKLVAHPRSKKVTSL